MAESTLSVNSHMGDSLKKTMITIRKEIPEDATAVRSLHEQAFGQTNEADLVDALRNSNAFIFSLVA